MPGPKLSFESDALYERIAQAAQHSEEGMRKFFYQDECQSLASELAKDSQALLCLINELAGQALLRSAKAQGAFCWSVRPRHAAQQIRGLQRDERAIYEYVEQAHTKGTWVKDIKKRSGLPLPRVDKIMQKLEAGRLVKVIRNVRSPAHKTYILYHLIPSDDVTGGSFYDGGDLDESLVEELGNLIVFHVRTVSWSEQKVPKRVKRERAPVEFEDEDAVAGAVPESNRNKKRKRTNDIEDAEPPRHKQRPNSDHGETMMLQLAFPAYSKDYPTASDIHSFITTTNVIRAAKAQQLTVAEIQSVINVLVWDDKLENVGNGYRTVRGVSFRPPGMDEEDVGSDNSARVGNGLTQAPCGRCPVFDLCGRGGAVNSEACGYWTEWLEA